MKLLLVGAGGHASVVAALVRNAGHEIAAYVARDEQSQPWLETARCIAGGDDEVLRNENLVLLAESFAMGVGGVTPDQLAARLQLFKRYAAAFARPAPVLVHSSAFAADQNAIGPGAVVMPGAIVNPNATVGAAAIINSGAIVEHDAVVEDGAHVAPGAIVLGGAKVGAHTMVGAGAVILSGAVVASGRLVPALTRYGTKAT